MLTAPPEPSELAYTDEYNLDVYSTVGNVMKIEKEGGVSILIQTNRTAGNPRYGVWGVDKNIYSSDVPKYKASSILLDNKQLEYAGLYEGEEGTESQAFEYQLYV